MKKGLLMQKNQKQRIRQAEPNGKLSKKMFPNARLRPRQNGKALKMPLILQKKIIRRHKKNLLNLMKFRQKYKLMPMKAGKKWAKVSVPWELLSLE
jgi:hypothetical protein